MSDLPQLHSSTFCFLYSLLFNCTLCDKQQRALNNTRCSSKRLKFHHRKYVIFNPIKIPLCKDNMSFVDILNSLFIFCYFHLLTRFEKEDLCQSKGSKENWLSFFLVLWPDATTKHKLIPVLSGCESETRSQANRYQKSQGLPRWVCLCWMNDKSQSNFRLFLLEFFFFLCLEI